MLFLCTYIRYIYCRWNTIHHAISQLCLESVMAVLVDMSMNLIYVGKIKCIFLISDGVTLHKFLFQYIPLVCIKTKGSFFYYYCKLLIMAAFNV